VRSGGEVIGEGAAGEATAVGAVAESLGVWVLERRSGAGASESEEERREGTERGSEVRRSGER
jgi:hypothetical protein